MAKYIFLFTLCIILGLIYIKYKYIREPFETFEAYKARKLGSAGGTSAIPTGVKVTRTQ